MEERATVLPQRKEKFTPERGRQFQTKGRGCAKAGRSNFLPGRVQDRRRIFPEKKMKVLVTVDRKKL